VALALVVAGVVAVVAGRCATAVGWLLPPQAAIATTTAPIAAARDALEQKRFVTIVRDEDAESAAITR
jgi:hypothetical protein